MERLGSSNETASHDLGEDGEITDDSIDPLELLVRKLSLPPYTLLRIAL